MLSNARGEMQTTVFFRGSFENDYKKATALELNFKVGLNLLGKYLLIISICACQVEILFRRESSELLATLLKENKYLLQAYHCLSKSL